MTKLFIYILDYLTPLKYMSEPVKNIINKSDESDEIELQFLSQL